MECAFATHCNKSQKWKVELQITYIQAHQHAISKRIQAVQRTVQNAPVTSRKTLLGYVCVCARVLSALTAANCGPRLSRHFDGLALVSFK